MDIIGHVCHIGHMRESASHTLARIAGSQRKAADAIGVHEETFSRWVRGRKIEPEYLKAIAELLVVVPPKDWPDRWKQRNP